MAERKRLEVPVTVGMTEEMTAELDGLAAEQGQTRSHVLREALLAGLPLLRAEYARRRVERERLAVPA